MTTNTMPAVQLPIWTPQLGDKVLVEARWSDAPVTGKLAPQFDTEELEDDGLYRVNYDNQTWGWDYFRIDELTPAQNTPADVGNYFEQDALAQSEIDERGEYAELSADDFRELVGCGDLVRYDRRGYGWTDGNVVKLCAEKDRALIRFNDEWGIREYWCSLDYLTLLLKSAALETE